MIRHRRTSLASRFAILAVVVVVLTAVIAGGLGVGLIRQASSQSARRQLVTVANQTRLDLNAGTPTARARLALGALKIDLVTFTGQGRVAALLPRVRAVLTPAEVDRVLAGQSLSTTTQVGGRAVLVEARPTDAGGLVLLERRSDALAVGDRAVRRLLVALVIAGVVAALLGLVVAWRLARPLRRTAAAAHQLAEGRRDIAIPVEGPAEVAEVAEALHILAASLGASEARQREFLLTVSHDLRTPLTAITGYAESIADGVITTDQLPQVGAVMLGEARRLERLVADLLDLARLEAQEFRVDLIDVDVRSLLAEAGAVWSVRCAAAEVLFVLEPPNDPVLVRSDPLRIRQILDGLLENALRLTPAGRPIVLAAYQGGADRTRDSVLFEVRDGGPGLTDADLADAFDRFVLYDRYRGVRQTGTGLGLTIVQRLTERLGGRVEAGHAAEGGARFTVQLPRGQTSR